MSCSKRAAPSGASNFFPIFVPFFLQQTRRRTFLPALHAPRCCTLHKGGKKKNLNFQLMFNVQLARRAIVFCTSRQINFVNQCKSFRRDAIFIT